MSTISAGTETPSGTPNARAADMRLEIVVIPVSDVDRAKRFYGGGHGGDGRSVLATRRSRSPRAWR
jgi:hypothetical protein